MICSKNLLSEEWQNWLNERKFKEWSAGEILDEWLEMKEWTTDEEKSKWLGY